MQCAERRQRNLRGANLETGAIDRVELPRRQDRYGAGRQFHVHELTRWAPLTLNATHAPPVYADLYAETYGVREEPAELVPYIVDAFFKGDVQFQRAIREKGEKAAAENPPGSPAGDETRPGAEPSTREFRKPRPIAPRPAAAEVRYFICQRPVPAAFIPRNGIGILHLVFGVPCDRIVNAVF